MATQIDRAVAIQAKDTEFTGIDFVRVEDPCEQTKLRIYLITDGRKLTSKLSGSGALSPENIQIVSVSDASLPPVKVVSIAQDAGDAGALPPVLPSQVQFDAAEQRSYIEITTAGPGTFARYQLHIDDPLEDLGASTPLFSRFDRFFNDKVFSFKAGCADGTDCVPAAPVCPEEPKTDFPVDYLARDFVSLRNALLDFAAQRYPHWTLPVEADVGMMLAEVMAALGDEFAYIQDRHAREAYLETASERRSLRKKARLLDFEIHDGRSATTVLELVVDSSGAPIDTQTPNFVLAGSGVRALSENGDFVPFEIGSGMFDRVKATSTSPTATLMRKYAVRDGWNAGALEPYFLDASQACLEVGATEVLIKGEVEDRQLLETDPASGDPPHLMLLRTDPADLSVPARVHVVRIAATSVFIDPLLTPQQTVTRIRWDEHDALPFQLDQTVLKISLNVVPATAGETREQRFAVRPDLPLADDVLQAVERQGSLKLPSPEREGITLQREQSQRPAVVLLGLPGTEQDGLGFVGSDLRNTTPEIEVLEDVTGGNAWTHVRSMLEAKAGDEVFTLEDGVWRRVRGFRRLGGELVHRDYATGAGFSVRFGDGEFGRVPESQGFRVRYRTGPGSRANVAAGSINALDTNDFGARDTRTPNTQWWIKSANNPLAVTAGVDPETAREIKQLTPQAYQAEMLFAVRPADYGEQAQRLDFVQRAQGTVRWTGSWPSIFVSADPFGASNLSQEQRSALEGLMDCVRQAGRDVLVRDPKTLAIDVTVRLCVEPTAYAAHVAAQAREVLVGTGSGGSPKGFFHPDNFSFGTPLRRSALEAAVQSIPGVRSVRGVWVRLRGVRQFRRMTELVLNVGRDEVLRLDDNPQRPEAGRLQFETEGGA